MVMQCVTEGRWCLGSHTGGNSWARLACGNAAGSARCSVSSAAMQLLHGLVGAELVSLCPSLSPLSCHMAPFVPQPTHSQPFRKPLAERDCQSCQGGSAGLSALPACLSQPAPPSTSRCQGLPSGGGQKGLLLSRCPKGRRHTVQQYERARGAHGRTGHRPSHDEGESSHVAG